MSGHSKWSNIKNKKGVADQKRGKHFSMLSRNIRVAVRESGIGDPAQNPALRVAVDKARAANMPMENIKRAIDRGLGVGKGGSLEEVVYEGYGPHGVGFLLVIVTDNKVRTASEIRSIFTKHNGSLSGPGSVSFMFVRTDFEYKVSIPLTITDSSQKADIEAFEELLHNHDDVEDVFHVAVWAD